ncbi:MAG: hypothetical protein ACI4D8_04505, partial [Wujia sp.]
MILEFFYGVSLFFNIILINVFYYKKNHDNKRLKKTLQRVILSVTIVVSAGVIAIFMPNEEIALFFQVIHYAGTEVMLVCLMCFLEIYVDNIKSTRITKTIIIVYCIF